ncbi:MAG: pyridoxal phosphate-dependent aminotransferase [Chloroflexia bacterium]
MRFAERMSRLGTETAFEVLAKAKALEAQGREVIHLEIGEPDFDTPTNIIETAVQALRTGHTHYTPSAGIPELREAVAEEVARTRHIPVRPENVVIVPGGKPIIFFTILALVDPGDEVIYPNPGFPIYESMINFVGAKAVPVPLLEENDFAFDLDIFRRAINRRTKLVIINSPQNPTGGVLSRPDLETIAELVQENDAYVLSDEIYSRILYEGEFVSIASLPGMPERTIILDGFSKTYAMTGWRMGYGVMPEALAAGVTRLVTNSVSCTAAFTQRAGIAGLTGPQEAVEQMVAEFRRRRDVIVAGLNAIPGVRCRTPAGAFYAFPNVQALGRPSKEIADYLLQEAGVAVLSGTAFGEYGEGYLRLSYANSIANIQKALERMREALGRL